jgi:outer membrane protein, heavy metal efflux system
MLTIVSGCQTPTQATHFAPESLQSTQAASAATLGFALCSASEPGFAPPGSLDLHALWKVAESHNPSLREAAADVDAAAGAQVQSGKYPNPRFLFQEDSVGARVAPAGNLSLQITQEIVTAGKRRLDVAISGKETGAAGLALVGRRFEVMTRLRRAYYAYLGASNAYELNSAAVASLREAVARTRKLVENVQNRPRSDLLRLEVLLEETQISQRRSQIQMEAAWKLVAVETGVTDLPVPQTRADLATNLPAWSEGDVWQRVVGANSAIRRAALEVDTARLAFERARAEAIPNVTVGAGYGNLPVENTAGAMITLEVPLPVWDQKQGHVRAAQAKLVKAQAALGTMETALYAATQEAFARYESARHQVEKLQGEVIPRLLESRDLLLKSYELGAAGVNFSDVLMTEQSLIASRLTLAESRQNGWQAVADLQGLMQIDVEDGG